MVPRAELSFPKIQLELLEDLSPPNQTGFLRLVRHRYRAIYPDGTKSEPFIYDAVDRSAIDAVVIVAHFVSPDGTPRVYLRSAFRPPTTLRDRENSPLPDEACDGNLWELPAGLIERSERSAVGAVRAAQRELHEELGFEVSLDSLSPLGPSTFPAPGFVAERHFFFEVRVDPAARREPGLDGSALERFGKIIDLSLRDALELCKTGAIEDAKTELALRRLLEKLY
ncbi:MAG TPA: NUDIX hydrolase [Polyangiaceae bacterium]|nr:NUDIX hydrolase [Polyangiaceae bacterium]